VKEGTFGKGYLAGVGEILQAQFARLIKPMSILFDETKLDLS
jgi:hypothetical protein